MIEVEFNKKGNGACPICIKNKKCRIQETTSHTLLLLKENSDIELELVIYRCPKFIEIK